jgi:flagellar biosynthesis component FlhA
MPGKQMAIDADLNAGLINEAEARQRRVRIQKKPILRRHGRCFEICAR